MGRRNGAQGAYRDFEKKIDWFVEKYEAYRQRVQSVAGEDIEVCDLVPSTITIGVVCNSGKHRSVAFADRLARSRPSLVESCSHRDIEKNDGDTAPVTSRKGSKWFPFPRKCNACDRTLEGIEEWNVHRMSKTHMKRQ